MAFEAQQGRRSRLVDLVIPVTTQPSNFISSDQYEQFTHLAILAPAGTFDGTINLEANNDPSADETADAQWSLYHPITPGTAVVLVATEMIVIPSPPTHGFRLKSTVNEDPGLTFKVWGIIIPR